MGRKGVKKQFWMTKELAEELSWKASKACLTESTLIRMLIRGYHPPAAPGEEFYKDLNKLIQKADRMQLTSEIINDPDIKTVLTDTAADLKKLSFEIRKRYLRGEREKIEWR